MNGTSGKLRIAILALIGTLGSSIGSFAAQESSSGLEGLRSWFRDYSRANPALEMANVDSVDRESSEKWTTVSLVNGYRQEIQSAELLMAGLAQIERERPLPRVIRAFQDMVRAFHSAGHCPDAVAAVQLLVHISAHIQQHDIDGRLRPDLAHREAVRALADLNSPTAVAALVDMVHGRSATLEQVGLPERIAAVQTLMDKLATRASNSGGMKLSILDSLVDALAAEDCGDKRLARSIVLAIDHGVRGNEDLEVPQEWKGTFIAIILRALEVEDDDLAVALFNLAVVTFGSELIECLLRELPRLQEPPMRWKKLWRALEVMAPAAPEPPHEHDTERWLDWLGKLDGKAWESGRGFSFLGIPVLGDVVFVVDVSEQMQESTLTGIDNEMRLLFDKLPQDILVSLITCGQQVKLVSPPSTSSRANVSRALRDRQAGGCRAFVPAILQAMGYPADGGGRVTGSSAPSPSYPGQIIIVSRGALFESAEDLRDRLILLNRQLMQRTGRCIRISMVHTATDTLSRLFHQYWQRVTSENAGWLSVYRG
ncbi:MAG: vWA domain-containing protein [Planctomycetota bacterium]